MSSLPITLTLTIAKLRWRNESICFMNNGHWKVNSFTAIESKFCVSNLGFLSWWLVLPGEAGRALWWILV